MAPWSHVNRQGAPEVLGAFGSANLPDAGPGRDNVAENDVERHRMRPCEPDLDLDGVQRGGRIVAPHVQPRLEGVHVDDGRDMADLERQGNRAIQHRGGAVDVAEMPCRERDIGCRGGSGVDAKPEARLRSRSGS